MTTSEAEPTKLQTIKSSPPPLRPTATTKLSLSTLPGDILINIISFLPSLPPETTSRHLKEAYDNLSLARLQPRWAYFSNSQVVNVTTIDPFPGISHIAPVAHLPPYACPRFLAFLVGLCRNLDTLRAPCLRGVLQYAGDKLRDISLIDTGLSDADLLFLSRSSLRYVSIKSPSPPVLTALAQVRTLEHVSLRRISEEALPHVLNFLACTTVESFYTSVNSNSPEPLYALLQGLPPLKTFILKCEVHQLWALRYLRRIAMQVEYVEMIVGGMRIEILALDECDMNSYEWDIETMRRLICRKDIGTNELSTVWRDCMSIREIDLEALQQTINTGVSECDIKELIRDYFWHEGRDFEDIHVHFGSNIPSEKCAQERIALLFRTHALRHVTNLKISQDVVLYAWKHSPKWSNFLTTLLDRFSRISTLHLCTPIQGRAVSTRFVMGLPSFLRMALSYCPTLACVYLEDVGELVLQSIGMPVLTDETRVKELIKAVIAAVKKLEVDKWVEMGTVIAQLELWAGSDLRVVDGKDLDDVAFLALDTDQPCSNTGKDWCACEACERDRSISTSNENSARECDSSEHGSSDHGSDGNSSDDNGSNDGSSSNDDMPNDSSEYEVSDAESE